MITAESIMLATSCRVSDKFLVKTSSAKKRRHKISLSSAAPSFTMTGLKIMEVYRKNDFSRKDGVGITTKQR